MSVREGRIGEGSDVILWMCEAPEPEGTEISHHDEAHTQFEWIVDGQFLRS